jgi:hypothetical protein
VFLLMPALASNGTLRHPLSMESHHFLITRDALVPADLLFAFGIGQARENGLRAGWYPLLFCWKQIWSGISGRISWLFGARRRTFHRRILDERQRGTFVIQQALEMFAQILHDVIAIRYLRGMRQDLTHRIGKGDFTDPD